MWCIERTDFEECPLWEGIVVLKGLIWEILTFGGCGGLERTDFWIIFCLGGVVVLKGLILEYWLIFLYQITVLRIKNCLPFCLCVYL